VSITRTVLNIDEPDAAIAAANWNHADKATYVLVDTTALPSGAREAVYQKTDGDSEHPMSERLGVYPNAKANDGFGKVNTSSRMTSYLEILDTVTGIASYYPCACVIAFEFPGNSPIPNVADAMAMLQNNASFLLPLVAGEFASDVLEQLQFGVVNGALVVDDPTA